MNGGATGAELLLFESEHTDVDEMLGGRWCRLVPCKATFKFHGQEFSWLFLPGVTLEEFMGGLGGSREKFGGRVHLLPFCEARLNLNCPGKIVQIFWSRFQFRAIWNAGAEKLYLKRTYLTKLVC